MIRPSFISEADWKCLTKKYNEKKLKKVVKKIEKDYPIQYAVGNVQFLDSVIDVSKSVLIPRFETELLVDKLRKYIKNNNLQNSSILDLCTGSGCIAVTLKKSNPNADVVAVDKSIKALTVAKINAKKNNVKINFLRKDVLKKCSFKQRFSIIVSNPPYVKLNEPVSPNTKYEPQMALYPGEDDIIFYKKIIDMSLDITYPKSIIAFEIGSTQSGAICKYAKKVLKDAKIVVEKDYNNFARFIFIFNNCE